VGLQKYTAGDGRRFPEPAGYVPDLGGANEPGKARYRDLDLSFMPTRIQQTAVLLLALTALLACADAEGQKSTEPTGSVCTGVFLVFISPENSRGVHITVGDSEKFYFNHPNTVVLNNLDVHKTYVVRIFDGDRQTDSWKLRFDRLKANMVTIWRSPGYWHMDPNPSGKCGEK
jgi:hypothetical protein